MAVEKLVDLDVPPRAQAIRVILTELQRIASHLVWLGTPALDLAAMSIFLYCFREREDILDILELCLRPAHDDHLHPPRRASGGMCRSNSKRLCATSSRSFPKRIDQYEALLTRNPLFLDRTLGIGKI